MKLTRILSRLIFGIALFGFFQLGAREVNSDCRCACVNGEVVPLCSNSLDLPPICAPRICPIVPSAIEPIQPPRIPPVGTSQCTMKQVLNRFTGRYEWKEICY